MKVVVKLVYIGNYKHLTRSFTYGDIYNVSYIEEDCGYCYITDNDSIRKCFIYPIPACFESLKEYRRRKLEAINESGR